MVQNYRYLNSWTIKNNYPLPLISDLIDSIGKKRVFTKMDLRWKYNNMRIKEGDEWKAAFSTPERSFESTVMFFGLTNSPVSRTKEVDLIFFIFPFSFYFLFDLFSFILFLEPGLGLEVTRSRCHTAGHKSHDT